MVEKYFSAIDNQTLVDRVEANLVKLLNEKKLKVGDSIPKEIELAALLGVSRTVVREALLRLRMMGLIESKKKKGAVITNPDLFSTLSKSMNPYILSDETLKEIFELRLVLEIGMADLLFMRVTPADITALQQIVKDEPSVSQNTMFLADYEISFHGKLYEITGNESLMKFQKMLLPIFSYVDKTSIVKVFERQAGFVSHKELVQILETGTPLQFREAMRAHLDSQFHRITV